MDAAEKWIVSLQKIQRRRKLTKYCQKIAKCDTLVTLEPENLFYLTGFWGEAIGVLDKNGNTTIIAPELEIGRAKDESIDCKVIKSDRGISSLTSLKNKIVVQNEWDRYWINISFF